MNDPRMRNPFGQCRGSAGAQRGKGGGGGECGSEHQQKTPQWAGGRGTHPRVNGSAVHGGLTFIFTAVGNTPRAQYI